MVYVSFLREIKKNWMMFLMAAPAVVFIFVFSYMPMFGIILAFKNFSISKGILGSSWVGFSNFKFLFMTTDAYVITRNTILYNFVFIITGTVAAVFFAILMSELRNRFFAKIYQTIAIMPYFLSMVIVAFIVYAFLNSDSDRGFLNEMLISMGKEPVLWYSEAAYWPFILSFVYLWKSVGFGSVIYLATITGISKEYYEAAVIDGAGKWQQTKSITIPFLKPILIILTILSIGRIFYADFGLFYQVTRNTGQLYSATNVIDVYIYNALMHNGNIGMSAAASLYQSFIGFILVLASNFTVKKIDKEYALF